MGFDEDGKSIQELSIFHIATGDEQILTSLLPPITGGLLIVQNSIIMICGGHDRTGTILSKCSCLTKVVDSQFAWVKGPEMNAPRINASLTYIKDSPSDEDLTALIAGGKNQEGFESTTEKLLLKPDICSSNAKWIKSSKNSFQAVAGHCLVALPNTILSTGGYSLANLIQKTTYIYNYINKEWQDGFDLNVARTNHACSPITLGSGKVTALVIGGHGESSDDDEDGDLEELKSAEILDIVLGWHTIISLPKKLIFSAGINLNGRFLVVGGKSEDRSQDLVWMYNEVTGWHRAKHFMGKKMYGMKAQGLQTTTGIQPYFEMDGKVALFLG